MNHAQTLQVMTKSLRIRETPIDGQVIGAVRQGERYLIHAKKRGWYQIKLANQNEGWISGRYVKLIRNRSKDRSLPAKRTLEITTESLRVLDRKNSGDVIALVLKGNIYPILEHQDNWYQILLRSGKNGWVSGKSVRELNPKIYPLRQNTESVSKTERSQIEITEIPKKGISKHVSAIPPAIPPAIPDIKPEISPGKVPAMKTIQAPAIRLGVEVENRSIANPQSKGMPVPRNLLNEFTGKRPSSSRKASPKKAAFVQLKRVEIKPSTAKSPNSFNGQIESSPTLPSPKKDRFEPKPSPEPETVPNSSFLTEKPDKPEAPGTPDSTVRYNTMIASLGAAKIRKIPDFHTSTNSGNAASDAAGKVRDRNLKQDMDQADQKPVNLNRYKIEEEPMLLLAANNKKNDLLKKESLAETPETKEKKKKKKDKFKLDGNFKFSFRFAKNRAKLSENRGGFELSALNLKAKYRFQKGVELRVRYQIDPLESELKEGFVRLQDDDAIFDMIQMGLQPRIAQLESDLETDSLNKIAFYRSRDLGILAQISFLDQWRWLIQFSNGGQLDKRDISPRRVIKQDVILSDSLDKKQALGTNSRELSMGLGYRPETSNQLFKKLQILLFLSFKPIADDDVEDLSTLSDVPGYTGVNNGTTSYGKIGLNIVWEYKKWRSYSQYVNAKVRDLDRNLFTTEWRYRIGNWKPIFAYSQQNLSVDPVFSEPLSWRRRRLTMGLHYQWLNDARFAAEFTNNDEDTGGKPITNDELILSWIYSF
ncbi:MAG: SH3 domain-containing protein [SAR324 cluster bacterium]|nr:SH3 domain-containing protein [SAR324 cluster bacterium]